MVDVTNIQGALRSRAKVLKSGEVYYATSTDGDIMARAAEYIDALERDKSARNAVDEATAGLSEATHRVALAAMRDERDTWKREFERVADGSEVVALRDVLAREVASREQLRELLRIANQRINFLESAHGDITRERDEARAELLHAQRNPNSEQSQRAHYDWLRIRELEKAASERDVLRGRLAHVCKLFNYQPLWENGVIDRNIRPPNIGPRATVEARLARIERILSRKPGDTRPAGDGSLANVTDAIKKVLRDSLPLGIDAHVTSFSTGRNHVITVNLNG